MQLYVHLPLSRWRKGGGRCCKPSSHIMGSHGLFHYGKHGNLVLQNPTRARNFHGWRKDLSSVQQEHEATKETHTDFREKKALQLNSSWSGNVIQDQHFSRAFALPSELNRKSADCRARPNLPTTQIEKPNTRTRFCRNLHIGGDFMKGRRLSFTQWQHMPTKDIPYEFRRKSLQISFVATWYCQVDDNVSL